MNAPAEQTPIQRALAWARAAGMNQTQFGAALGVTPQDITNWKRRGMPPEYWVPTVRLLGHGLDELVGLSGPGGWPFATVEKSRWDACNERERGFVEGAVDGALARCEVARLARPSPTTPQPLAQASIDPRATA